MSLGAAEPKPEAYGPEGDPARHLPLDELVARVCSLPPPPRDSGRLHLIVRRHADGTRETLERARLTAEGGIPGDRWGRKLPVNSEAQLTVMRRDIAEVIANGQPLTMFGDNLFVDLDISAENLPVGTRAWLGDALLEVTPKPHNGCLKFKGRFGQDALEFVQAKETRSQNYRGIYFRVVEAGEAGVGASISVIRTA